jgi:N-acetyl-beta-hexosaminidase
MELYLAPIPKTVTPREGRFSLSGRRYIRLEAADAQSLIPAADRTGLDWELTASPKAPKGEVGLVIRLDEASDIPDQGYKLTIDPAQIEIVASTPAGAFYGACTLAQIIRQSGDELPCLSISDWPDFQRVG